MYDMKNLDFDEIDVDTKDWNFRSAINPKVVYQLKEQTAHEYFDYKNRFLVKSGTKSYYA